MQEPKHKLVVGIQGEHSFHSTSKEGINGGKPTTQQLPKLSGCQWEPEGSPPFPHALSDAAVWAG